MSLAVFLNSFLLFLLLSGLLGLFLALPHLLGKQRLELIILNLLVAIELVSRCGTTADDHCRRGLDDESSLELGNKLTRLLGHDLVLLEHLVLNALLNTNLGAGHIFEASNRERHSRELLVHDGQESARVLALQAILNIEFPLVDSRASLGLPANTGAGRSVNVEADDISGSELPVLRLLIRNVLVQDAVTTVNHVLLVLVAEDSMKWLTVILLHNFLNVFSEHSVLRARLHQVAATLECIVSSEDAIGRSALSSTTDDNGLSSKRCIAVHVCAKIDADQITILKGSRVLFHR